LVRQLDLPLVVNVLGDLGAVAEDPYRNKLDLVGLGEVAADEAGSGDVLVLEEKPAMLDQLSVADEAESPLGQIVLRDEQARKIFVAEPVLDQVVASLGMLRLVHQTIVFRGKRETLIVGHTEKDPVVDEELIGPEPLTDPVS